MCKIIRLPDGELRYETPYVLNFRCDPEVGLTTGEPDLLHLRNDPNRNLWSLPTAVSFICEYLYLEKTFDESVELQFNVGPKSCGRYMFIHSGLQTMTETLVPLQGFGFSFPLGIPQKPFSIYLIGKCRFPVP